MVEFPHIVRAVTSRMREVQTEPLCARSVLHLVVRSLAFLGACLRYIRTCVSSAARRLAEMGQGIGGCFLRQTRLGVSSFRRAGVQIWTPPRPIPHFSGEGWGARDGNSAGDRAVRSWLVTAGSAVAASARLDQRERLLEGRWLADAPSGRPWRNRLVMLMCGCTVVAEYISIYKQCQTSCSTRPSMSMMQLGYGGNSAPR